MCVLLILFLIIEFYLKVFLKRLCTEQEPKTFLPTFLYFLPSIFCCDSKSGDVLKLIFKDAGFPVRRASVFLFYIFWCQLQGMSVLEKNCSVLLDTYWCSVQVFCVDSALPCLVEFIEILVKKKVALSEDLAVTMQCVKAKKII